MKSGGKEYSLGVMLAYIFIFHKFLMIVAQGVVFFRGRPLIYRVLGLGRGIFFCFSRRSASNDLCYPLRYFLLLLLPLFFLVASSCAYKMGFSEGVLPGGYRQISIPIFKNKTQEVGAEAYFTNALLQEFHRSRGVTVQSMELAPVSVEASIDHIGWRSLAVVTGVDTFGIGRTAPFLPPQSLLATEYRVEVRVNMLLRRKSDDRVLWRGSLIHEKKLPSSSSGFRGG